MNTIFVSDLHGQPSRYEKLFHFIKEIRPQLVLIGGDIFPHRVSYKRFLKANLVPALDELRRDLRSDFPVICAVFGNDDPRSAERDVKSMEAAGYLRYCHGRGVVVSQVRVWGYNCVPPTPFLLKDWERFDVSRYVDPGCIAPDEGQVSVKIDDRELKWTTIEQDLERLVGDAIVTQDVFLFHSPPYNTDLDRAALDGIAVDYAPLDVHVGSVAIRRFIEARQPLLTLHGHVHESTRLTGQWRQVIGRTLCFNAAHDGPELSVIQLDLANPATATRLLL